MYLDNNYTTAFNQVLVIMYYSRDHNFHFLSQTDGALPLVTSKKIHADIAKKLLSYLRIHRKSAKKFDISLCTYIVMYIVYM